MTRYKITYLDYVDAESIEEAEDILLERLMLDVKYEDASRFNIISAFNIRQAKDELLTGIDMKEGAYK